MLMRTAGRIFDLDDLSTAPGISTWLNSWCRDVGPSFLFLGAIDAKSSVPIDHQSLVDLAISGDPARITWNERASQGSTVKTSSEKM